MNILSVVRSLFSKESIAEFVKENYPLAGPVESQLLDMRKDDNYLIKAGTERYVFRLYKPDFQNLKKESDYLFELDWLKYLQEKRCAISYPVARKDGSFLGSIQAPEGLRYYVLFSFAEGDHAFLNRKRAFLLGKEIARIHMISKKFQTSHEKPPLDLNFLLEIPVLNIKKYLGTQYAEEQERLDALAVMLKEKILSLLYFKGNDWGLIGGDFHGFNQNFVGDRRLTLFDFDLCGYGWRSYDLAVFRWLQLSDLNVGENIIKTFFNGRYLIWSAFLSGYQSVRRLSPAELEAIPFFVQIRQIWWMSTCVQSPNPLVPLQFDFWERNFKRLFKSFQ